MKAFPKVKIRPASKADVPALTALIAASARGLSQGFYSPEQIESAITHVFGVDSQLVADRTYFVVEIDDKMVGCGGWSKRKTLYDGDQFKTPASDPLLDPKEEAARIRAFFVHPEYGRRGIGKALLRACEEAAAAEGFSHLELGSTLPGVPFYSALGFEPFEERDLIFPDGIRLELLCMRKQLTS